MDRKKIACNCRNISYGKIEDAVKSGLKDFNEIKKILKFGNGCGECNDFIKYLINRIIEEETSDGRITGNKD